MIGGTWAAASMPLSVNPQAGQALAIGKTSRQHSLTGVWHQTLAPPGSAQLHALAIEPIGSGPGGGELVSVAHYDDQAGDLMRDPEIVFEVVAGRLGCECVNG